MVRFRTKTNIIAVDPVLQKVQIKEITLLLAASLLIPFLIHLIPPANGIRLGAVLLPMFYVPLIAVTFYKFHTALVVTAFAPILNYFLTGSPKLTSVPLLTFEVLVFVLIMILFLRYKKLNKSSTLISILTALVVPPVVLGLFSSSGYSVEHLLISLRNAVPGIILLTLLNIVLLRLRNK